GVDGPVNDGETDPDERDILSTGNVLAVCCPDDEVDFLLFDPLMEFEEVAFRLYFAALNSRIFKQFLDLNVKLFAGSACEDILRDHAHREREFRKGDDMIGVAKDRDRLSLVVEMGVDESVYDLASLYSQRFGDGDAEPVFDCHEEVICCFQAYRKFERDTCDTEFLLQKIGSIVGCECAKRDRCGRVGGITDLRDGCPALRVHLVLACQGRVQHV